MFLALPMERDLSVTLLKSKSKRINPAIEKNLANVEKLHPREYPLQGSSKKREYPMAGSGG